MCDICLSLGECDPMCPNASDPTEQECEWCGNWFDHDEIINGYCQECFEKMLEDDCYDDEDTMDFRYDRPRERREISH